MSKIVMSGDWVGIYNYGDNQANHTMEMNLSFAGGVLAGRGIDDVGMFTIRGTHSAADCFWTKTYNTHSVEYQGTLEGGRIWGTWHAGSNKGGFNLWPRKGNGPEAEEEVSEPIQVGERIAVLGGGCHAKPR
jgi:hypothetical protein